MAELTAADVKKFHTKNEERKRLAREAEDLEDEIAAIKTSIVEHVQKHGGKDRTTVFHGFQLRLKPVRGQPQWKELYTGEVGADKVEEMRQAAPMREQLEVEKVGKVAKK